MDNPIIRLKPNADARAIRHGYPWVFANDIVTDRRTRNLPAGTIATLEDNARTPMATVAVTPEAKLMVRVLDAPGTEIDAAWIGARLDAALALRERLFDAPFYRLVHAEADRLPGVIIDRFGDTAVVQPNAAWADARADLFAAALVERGMPNVLLNAGGRTRGLEGLDAESRVLGGEAPDAPLPVPMNGATYMADLTGGQKTGLFYDQRPNHAFAARLAQGRAVLDVFSHVGGFGLAALAGGSASALSVDGSAAALDLAQQGAKASGLTLDTRQGDAFDVMEALITEGARFGLVICDPPAFAPSKPALQAGLRAYEKTARLGAQLVEEGGTLMLCSCSHAATLDKFRNACIRGIGRAGRAGSLIRTGFAGPDHPVHPQLTETGYLKALTFQL